MCDNVPILLIFSAVRLTLIIQNVAVVACAVIVLIMFEQKVSSPIFIVLAVVLVLLAIVARLSSLGTTIAIERDWVVVIAKEDAFLLAGNVLYDVRVLCQRVYGLSNRKIRCEVFDFFFSFNRYKLHIATYRFNLQHPCSSFNRFDFRLWINVNRSSLYSWLEFSVSLC